MTHEFRVGDRLPSLEMQCKYQDGRAYDLTGHTVTFKLLRPDGTAKVTNNAPTIVAATTGWVRHDWGASDLDTAGDYRPQLVATRIADGKAISFPNTDDADLVKVRA